MPQRRELRDPIHGFVHRRRVEEGLIDTEVFQRLRGISQLALARLVYPGAVHTRFDHSIGVMHVAGKLAGSLLHQEEDHDLIRLVRLSALLHDIGHGPFSHVSENLLAKYAHLDELDFNLEGEDQEDIHEHLTCNIIEHGKELQGPLGGNERQRIIDLILGRPGLPSVAKGIVSGPLDADKQDYLLRDSHFCGVKYGVFDLDRLINTLRVVRQGPDRTLAISEDGVFAVEQFVIAKYHMTTQVYRHKIRLITDAMIVRGLELGIEKDQLNWLSDLYSYDGSRDYINNYLQWDDARLTTKLLHHPEKEGFAHDLFTRLRHRRLFKKVFSKRLTDFSPVARGDLYAVFHRLLWRGPKQETRRKIEERIAEYLSDTVGTEVPAEYTIGYAYKFKAVKDTSQEDEATIPVQQRGKRDLVTFDEASKLFDSIDKKQEEMWMDVYAPVTYAGEVQKKELLQTFDDDIGAILATAIGEFYSSEKGESNDED